MSLFWSLEKANEKKIIEFITLLRFPLKVDKTKFYLSKIDNIKNEKLLCAYNVLQKPISLGTLVSLFGIKRKSIISEILIAINENIPYNISTKLLYSLAESIASYPIDIREEYKNIIAEYLQYLPLDNRFVIDIFIEIFMEIPSFSTYGFTFLEGLKWSIPSVVKPP